MKKLVYVMSLVTMVLMMSVICSCGNGSKKQGEASEDSKPCGIIKDFDEGIINSGKFVFDAKVVVSATLDNQKTEYTITIDGKSVKVANDEVVMWGSINEDFDIIASCQPEEIIMGYSIQLSPTNREGTEWEGEYRSYFLGKVSLVLKESTLK